MPYFSQRISLPLEDNSKLLPAVTPKLKAKALLGTDTGGDMLSTFLSKAQVQPSPVRETKLHKRQRVERENVADRAGRQDGAQATPINGGL